MIPVDLWSSLEVLKTLHPIQANSIQVRNLIGAEQKVSIEK